MPIITSVARLIIPKIKVGADPPDCCRCVHPSFCGIILSAIAALGWGLARMLLVGIGCASPIHLLRVAASATRTVNPTEAVSAPIQTP
jgi:hypothetical protein